MEQSPLPEIRDIVCQKPVTRCIL